MADTPALTTEQQIQARMNHEFDMAKQQLMLVAFYLSNQHAPMGFDGELARFQNAVRGNLADMAKFFPAVKESA